MIKINKLDAIGNFVCDHIEGDIPDNWTADLVGDGYYKAQYQGAIKNHETGEFTGGIGLKPVARHPKMLRF